MAQNLKDLVGRLEQMTVTELRQRYVELVAFRRNK
jgi:hypothetical protein